MCGRESQLAPIRVVVTIFLLMIAADAWTQVYRLPFNGVWVVMQGGDTALVNQHMSVPAQRYGLDFAKVGEPDRIIRKPAGTTNEDYYSWGESVLSPVDGEVLAAVDAFPDNPLGMRDAKNLFGNYVAIKTANDRYVFLAHLQHNSILVSRGQRVVRGELLGKCGNSGNTNFPHLHMHVQNSETLNIGMGQRIEFSDITVELAGKVFQNVTWPLIRGLFVSNE